MGCLFDIDLYRQKVKEKEKKTYEANFWDDSEKAQKIMKEINDINSLVEVYDKLLEEIDELLLMVEMVIEEGSIEDYDEISKLTKLLIKKVDKFRLNTLLDGEYDSNSAVLSIHAGSGGVEAQDWAEMLLRMYTRWAERKNFKITTLDILPDTEAGIKSVTLLIDGLNAFGYLKSEKGVHRLVRISPFDSAGKRHTSFASVDVFPKIDESESIEIDEKDLKIDTYRSSGAGGQHVNVTDSAVRITHIPTGIVVQCQSERSQHSNRQTAMNMLVAKLIQLKEEEKKEKIEDLQGNYAQISWGSQIRSYVFHPYNMVKDHRTNTEVGDIQSVMDGDIDEFIDSYLKEKAN